MKYLILMLLAFLTSTDLLAQQDIKNLRVENFKVESTKFGSIPCPKMTEVQRDAIVGAVSGRCVYNTNTLKLNIYDGSTWKAAGGGVDSWVTGFAYTAGDLVIQSNKIYKALLNHTSGTFATDLANGDWVEVSEGITSTGSIADNRLVRYDGTSGTLIQSSLASLDDSGNLTGINNATIDGNFNLIGDATFKTSLTGLAKLASGVLSASALVNADVDPAAAISLSKLGLLSGYVAGSGTVTSSDSVQGAIQKIDGNVSSLAASATTAINGKQSLSALTTKGDIYAATAASTTTRVPVGNSGEILTVNPANSTGLGYREVKENNSLAFSFNGFEDISTWQKGNAASVVLPVTGSFAGTLASVTSSPLNDAASYRYTQAAGSLNDYWCSPTKTITPAQKGDTYFTANYTYDGQSGDLQPYLYDVTNSGLINLVAIKGLGATNTSMVQAYAALIPQSTSQVSLCYQVKTLNSGKIFNYATVQLTKSLQSLGIVNNTNFTNPEIYTPTILGLGAATSQCYKWQEGAFGNISCKITSGTPTTVNATVSLPTGWIVSSNPNVTGVFKAGSGTRSANNSTYAKNLMPITANGNNYVGFAYNEFDSAQDPLIYQLGTTIIGASQVISFNAKFLVQGFDVGNAQVASSNQITSSDSMVFTFKGTAIVDSDPVGTINSYSYASSSNTAVICVTAPTQSFSSMNVNGIQIFSKAYNAASTCASPARVDIKIGDKFKSWPVNAYGGLAKTIPLNYLTNYAGSSAEYYNSRVFYNSVTGILTIEAGVNGSAITIRNVGMDVNRTSYTNGYFTFDASTQPSVSVIPNASLCTSLECQDALSAYVNGTTGAITRQSSEFSGGNWLSSCIAGNPTDCTFSTALNLKDPMNCWAFPVGANVNGLYSPAVSSTTTVSIRGYNTTNGASLTSLFFVYCQKTGRDSRPPMFKTANMIGMPQVSGVVTNEVGSNFEIVSFKFGATMTSACTTVGVCPYLKNLGVSNGAVSVSKASNGVYSIVTRRTYIDFHCTGSTRGASVYTIPWILPALNTNTYTLGTDSGSNAATDSFGTINCIGSF